MTYIRFFLMTSIFSFIIVVLMFFNFKSGGAKRNVLDYKINKISKIHDRNYDAIILSDSVTHAGIRYFKKDKTVLDMSTVASIGIHGNLFLLNRFLINGNRTKKLFYFILPSSVELDLTRDASYPYSYMTSIFKNEYEVNFLKKFNKENLYFEDRLYLWMSSLSPFNREYLYDSRYFTIQPHTRGVSPVKPEIIETKCPLKPHHTSIVTLNNMINIASDNEIEFVVVFEPRETNIFNCIDQISNSLKGEFKVLDVNNYLSFDESSFRDGVHLIPSEEFHYLNWLNNNLVKWAAVKRPLQD
jgi:hypothetical protein